MSDQEKAVPQDEEQNTSPEMQEEQREGEAEVEASADAAKDLTALLEDARNKADDHWNQFLRVQAEMDNLRKRSERDLENAHKFALEKFSSELLPVKDSLEMGLAAASGDDEAVAKLREGMELTLKILSSTLEKFGIVEVNPEGETFNPELHQAMSMQESAELEPNTVMAVMQKGYQLHGRLIRPAMVMVSKAAG